MRKTVDVADVRAMVNTVLAAPDRELPFPQPGKPGKWEDVTVQQAYRLGMATLLEAILHRTGGYRGFSYHDVDFTADPPGIPDETRRTYT